MFTGVIVGEKTHLEQEDAIQQKLYKSMVGKLMFEATPFGQKRSAKDFATQMHVDGQEATPDWVDPPEGIQAEPGGVLDGGYNTRSKSRRSGAGLPIPEGCLDKARCEWENVQSSRDPGDM